MSVRLLLPFLAAGGIAQFHQGTRIRFKKALHPQVIILETDNPGSEQREQRAERQSLVPVLLEHLEKVRFLTRAQMLGDIAKGMKHRKRVSGSSE